MTKAQYDQIMRCIYENGRVIAEDDTSQVIEFDFEAEERGFSKEEIEEAHNKWD